MRNLKNIISVWLLLICFAIIAQNSYSEVKTRSLETLTISSSDIPIVIASDATDTIQSSLNISNSVTIKDVNVTLDITHTYDADLTISLVHPDGTTVVLSSGNGSSSDNYTDTTFDQASSLPITTASAPFTNTFQPEESLDLFNEKISNGAWTLKVADSYSADGGSLNSWSITIGFQEIPAGSTLVPNLVSLPQATAEANIVAANLQVGTITHEFSLKSIPTGAVISQSLDASSIALENSSVDMVVSLGPPPAISINFTDGGAGMGNSNILQIAGFAEVGNWETVSGNFFKNDTNLSNLRTNEGLALNVSFSWAGNSSGAWARPSGFDTDTALFNNKMLENWTATTGATLTFSGIRHFASVYDVYIYSTKDSEGTGSFSVDGVTKWIATSQVIGPFSESSSANLSAAQSERGTKSYVKFSDVSLTDLVVTVSATEGSVPINGIQIVQKQEPAPAITAPENLSASGVSQSGFDLNWVAPDGAVSYIVTVSTSENLSTEILFSSTPSTTFETITGLTPGTQCYFGVKSVDAFGDVSEYATGNVVLDAPTLAGGALSTALTGYLSATTSADFSSFTMMTWIKYESGTNIMSLSTSNVPKALIQKVGDTIVFNNGVTTASLPVILPTEKWVNLTVAGDASNSTLYLNGIFQGNFGTGIMGGADNFKIGEGVTGSYDETLLFNSKLTSDEIQKYVHSGIAVTHPNLVVQWDYSGTFPSSATVTGTNSLVSSGAMINISSGFATNSYLWNASVNGLPSTGLSVKTASTIVADNTGLFYGIKTLNNVTGISPENVKYTHSISRLKRIWKIEMFYADIIGDVSFDRSAIDIPYGDSPSIFELLYRNPDMGMSEFVNTGAVATIVGDVITFETVAFENGEYTLGALLTGLTPAVGLELSRNGNKLSWSLADERSVKQYNVIVNGVVIEVVKVSGKNSYSVILNDTDLAVLEVVDFSGFIQVFKPENSARNITTYHIKTGWNMIAVTSKSPDLRELREVAVGSIWTWDQNTGYKIIDNTIAPTDGIWVYSSSDKQFDISGEKSDTLIKLNAGWNMVGPTENSVIPKSAHAIFSWSDVYNRISLEDGILVEGIGYWIFAQ